MNNYTLILTDTPIIVSDEPIKADDKYLDELFQINTAFKSNAGFYKECKKIVYGLPHQPSIDFSLVQQWAEEHGIVDVEKLANENFPIGTWTPQSSGIGLAMFIDGFNTHKSLSGKRYSEEDIRNAFRSGKLFERHGDKMYNEDEYIQQLSSNYFNVELEMEYHIHGMPLTHGNSHITPDSKPKITNNAVKITKIL